jgi:HD-like signal output (HDOD) protein
MLPDVRLPWLEPSAEQALWPTYAEAGAYLLSLWGLPSALVEAAALHPTPALAGEQGLDVVGACHIAWAHASDLPLDEAWVESLSLSDQRESWQALAYELASLES